MKREIIINAATVETRVALLEDGILTEFYLERGERRGLVGNIYKGKVTRVLPGMQAAFVDIGLEKAGFLHVSDFYDDVEGLGSAAEVIGEEDVETEPHDGEPLMTVEFDDAEAEGADGASADDESGGAGEPGAEPAGRPQRGGRGRGRGRRPERRVRLPIEQQLKRGQEILVQIAKEPLGTKGARLTSFVSIPGRHLVYTPTSNHIGISRRIESAQERARLRAAVAEVRPAQGGLIVRTVCEGVSKRDIQRDCAFLTKLWSSIVKLAETSPPASLLYNDLDVALRIMRDLFSSEVDRLWCDEPATYERIVEFMQNYMPRLRSRIALYEAEEPIFDHFHHLEQQIERALERKVWLKSGGYLVFDQTEALIAIDVNTGRFVGKRNQDETVLRTNLEAAEEVVRQLRLRNIGGIIIIDFIDMTRDADRKRVTEVLGQALKRDKARSSMLKISELGLVQMTRKRTRESLEELLTEQCPKCSGRRVVKSVATLAADVLRGIHRAAGRHPRSDLLVIKVNPGVARYLYDVGAKDLEVLEGRLGIKIVLRSTESIEAGAFELVQATVAA
ncbi:MAG: Rne/Rng family ribonuclease [Candidatus Binataceae bacterium]|nr:Rne/Rng family ribonuclease [Candidatus Binataceae bacterium]